MALHKSLQKKIDVAIHTLKTYEPKAGYYIAFSGGKDSIVIYDLVKRAGVKHDVHYNVTTIDPPEVTRFIKKNYPEVERHVPEKSMFELVVKNRGLPTRIQRWCCRLLKEGGGKDRVVVLGVRREESFNRSDRNLFNWHDNSLQLNLIVDWLECDVWEYIEEYGLKYPCLYDEDYSRIGCIACPMAGHKQMKRELKRYPFIKRGYLKTYIIPESKTLFPVFNIFITLFVKGICIFIISISIYFLKKQHLFDTKYYKTI